MALPKYGIKQGLNINLAATDFRGLKNKVFVQNDQRFLLSDRFVSIPEHRIIAFICAHSTHQAQLDDDLWF